MSFSNMLMGQYLEILSKSESLYFGNRPLAMSLLLIYY